MTVRPQAVRPVRVLYLCVAPSGSAPYGVERIMLDLIGAMDPMCHQPVGVLLPSPGPTADAFHEAGVQVLGTSLPEPAVRHPQGAARFLGWAARLARELRRQPPDLISAAYQELNRHAVLLGAIMRRPVICHLFDDTPSSLYRIRWAHRCAAVVACSEAMAAQWATIPGARSKLRVIYPGIDPARFRRRDGARARIRREFSIGDGELLIGVASRLSPEKGVRDFVEAFGICLSRGVRGRALVIGGASDSTTAYADDVRRLAACYGDAITFPGFRADVADCYSAFDLLVVPSRHEGFGRALVEGMAAGLPVVATTAEAIPEVVVDGETGLLVKPGRPAALAEAMMRLLSDRSLARRMGEAGSDRVARLFTLRSQARAMQSLYWELTGALALGSEAARSARGPIGAMQL